MAPRIILHTGKGGVGKTSVAAATASLRRRAPDGGSLDRSGAQPLRLARGRAGRFGRRSARTSSARRCRLSARWSATWDGVQDWLGDLLAERRRPISAEELTVPPGMDELFSLLWIKRHHEADDFDCVVVDCAPTGRRCGSSPSPTSSPGGSRRCCRGSVGWLRWRVRCSTSRCRATRCSTTSSAWPATWWR